MASAPTETTREFWDQTLEEILRETDSAPQGLTSAEARSRLDTHGPNELARRRYGAALEILRFFVNPLVIILLFASLVSGVLGEYVNAGLIALMVVISVALNFYQAYQSQRAAEALRQSVVTTAAVLRDGKWVEAPRGQIVPGDVVRLAAGDLIPADARLLESHDLFTDEAALTGESLPVEKTARHRAFIRSPMRRGRSSWARRSSAARPRRWSSTPDATRRSGTWRSTWPRRRRRPSSSAAPTVSACSSCGRSSS
jgi:magnesium-transporting ATPase (P-type)